MDLSQEEIEERQQGYIGEIARVIVGAAIPESPAIETRWPALADQIGSTFNSFEVSQLGFYAAAWKARGEHPETLETYKTIMSPELVSFFHEKVEALRRDFVQSEVVAIAAEAQAAVRLDAGAVREPTPARRV